MAEPISMQALNGFRTAIANRGARETLKLDGGKNVVGNGTLSHFSSNIVRGDAAKEANNAVRRELLVNLGFALGLNEGPHVYMDEYENGQVALRRGFMDRLKELLGDKVIKSADFALDEDGYVTSGKPLTARRVKAIVAAAAVAADKLERHLRQATDLITTRILDIEKEDKTGVSGALKRKFGSGAKTVRANVRRTLESSQYFTDVMGGEPDEHFMENLKKVQAANLESQFHKRFVTAVQKGYESENMGFAQEMLRTGTGGKARWGNVRVNGRTLNEGDLANTPGYQKAYDQLRAHPQYDCNDSPFCNEESAQFCAALKALIPDTNVLKCVTTQLGLQAVPPTLTVEVPENLPLNYGGRNLANIAIDTLVSPEHHFGAQGIAGDAVTMGSVSILVRNHEVIVTQKFQLGLCMHSLDGALLTTQGSKSMPPVVVPMYDATSTIKITIPPEPQPFGTIPEYTTNLELEPVEV